MQTSKEFSPNEISDNFHKLFNTWLTVHWNQLFPSMCSLVIQLQVEYKVFF